MKLITWILSLLSALLIIGSLDAPIGVSQFILQECLGVVLACAAHFVSEYAEVSG